LDPPPPTAHAAQKAPSRLAAAITTTNAPISGTPGRDHGWIAVGLAARQAADRQQRHHHLWRGVGRRGHFQSRAARLSGTISAMS